MGSVRIPVFSSRPFVSKSQMTALGILIVSSVLTVVALLAPAQAEKGSSFVTSHECLACHNGLHTSSGTDVSLGTDWRPTAMANSGRDPYWLASARRETLDHPKASSAIEDECTICHMPQTTYEARQKGSRGRLFSLVAPATGGQALHAQDGVACSVCHQISKEGLGERKSFIGHYVIARSPDGRRPAFGPHEVTRGLARVMRSATGFEPTSADHLARSEMCATCHTLFTKALTPDGQVAGELPEQVPFLEWAHSSYRDKRSCQSCHMPPAEDPAPIASVLGEPRDGIARHVFEGGNFVLPRLLARARHEDRVPALPGELEAAAHRAIRHLAESAAAVRIVPSKAARGTLSFDVVVENHAGHKFPTAYPSRRAWLHVVVRDAQGNVLFESGALGPDGRIAGNDNDEDARRFEPHHRVISQPSEVQVYESIMVDAASRVTTGLLSGVRYVKDNRLLPQGFTKERAAPEVTVQGDATSDPDFVGGSDTTRYEVSLAKWVKTQGPLEVMAELYYQPIGYRWAHTLGTYRSNETERFIARFQSMAHASASRVASAKAVVGWEE